MDGYRRILAPTDLSPLSFKGVERAAGLARVSGAKVLLVFVVERAYFAPVSMLHQAPVTFRGEGDLLGEAVEYAEQRLKELRERHFAGLEVEAKVVVAATGASGILETADAFRPDLIVIASHGRSGVLHLLLGSTAEKVIRHAPCEVLVVRPRETP
jgi:nucleotide-binding universal stress UspA family protein